MNAVALRNAVIGQFAWLALMIQAEDLEIDRRLRSHRVIPDQVFHQLRNSTQLKPTQKSVFGARKCREYFLD
jgi:hypothetical protein